MPRNDFGLASTRAHLRVRRFAASGPLSGGHESHRPPFSSLENTRFEVETSDSGEMAEGQARRLDWRIQSVGGETILTVAVTVG